MLPTLPRIIVALGFGTLAGFYSVVHHGPMMGPSFGPSWALGGPSLAAASWPIRGHSLRPSWAHRGPNFGPAWALGGPSLGPSWALRVPSLGPSWAYGRPKLGSIMGL
jgi:hypothetical protein